MAAGCLILLVGLGIGAAVGPLLAAYVSDIKGSYDIAIIVAATVLFVLWVAL